MIQDQRHIIIDAPIERVFNIIETMPNKFPVYKILETSPIFFIRLLLVDGIHHAINAINIERPNDMLLLHVGDSMGPFKLMEVNRPFKYMFTLKSFFFNCRTGYVLSGNEEETTLSFVLLADDPSLTERLYWFLIKPVHYFLANKVLRGIKDRVESDK